MQRIYANLDEEARWAGRALPAHVLRRISAASALLSALVQEPAEIWAPAAVDPQRLQLPATMRVGIPARYDLAWADPDAKAANDRRFALALARRLALALPEARVIRSLDELDVHLAETKLARWVCKAPWTSAGRDRAHGQDAATGDTRIYLGRMLERFGELVFEPWMDRMFDVGVCAMLAATGEVSTRAPHTLLCDPRGGFAGIDLAPPPLTDPERALLDRTVAEVGSALAAIAYTGPFTIDAFVYRDRDARKLHPLCEINARHSFGHVAHALAARYRTRILGFGPPPPNAKLFIAPAADDPFTAWGA
ncbi:MAG: hypothetical protein JWO36_473 [Myxococcales bacterium]|nr:hypothetical protein [Myxococcales bacterium]